MMSTRTRSSSPAGRRRAAALIALGGILLAALFSSQERGAPPRARKMPAFAIARPVLVGRLSEVKRCIAQAPRRVWEAIAEEQLRIDEDGGQPKEEFKPVGVHFEPFAEAPERRLVEHPTLGKVIEIRFPNGGVLYSFNDDRYDVGTLRMIGREFKE